LRIHGGGRDANKEGHSDSCKEAWNGLQIAPRSVVEATKIHGENSVISLDHQS
jgi:hypothetical protein